MTALLLGALGLTLSLALVLFGGPVIRDFTIAMIWGVVVGTYSTVYVASPMVLHTTVPISTWHCRDSLLLVTRCGTSSAGYCRGCVQAQGSC